MEYLKSIGKKGFTELVEDLPQNSTLASSEDGRQAVIAIPSETRRYQKIKSYLKYFFYTDMLPLMKKINEVKHPITSMDLPVPFETYNIEEKVSLLSKNWAKTKNGLLRSSIIKPLFESFTTEAIKNTICVFFLVTGQILSSLLLGKIMGVITSSSFDTSKDTHDLIMYTMGFAVFYLMGFLFDNWWIYYSTTMASSLRLSITSLVYKKLNTVSLSSVYHISMGKVINLLANDVNDVDTSIFLYPMLVAPYTLALSYYIMWGYFGWYCLISIVLQVCLFSLALRVTNKSVVHRQERNLVTDQRIKYTNEFIENIRLIKLYAWEKSFLKIINELRDKEQAIFKRLGNIDAINRVLSDSSVYICIITTCIVYVLMGGVLSTEKVYTSMILLSFTGCWSIGFSQVAKTFLITARLMAKRVEDIMNIDEVVVQAKEPESGAILIKRDDDTSSASVDYEPSIVFRNYTAYWSKSAKKPCLENLNLEIHSGQFIVLIGKIGSGKTTFLQSLHKEIPVTSGYLSLNGSLAYVEQEPVIFSGSLRDNILFGSSYDKEFYHRVLRACNLDEDFRQLSFADQTIIGERGVTLSGGQKARLSMARALYARSDIYLLDDPLSAVDSRVGRMIYDKAIREMLLDKTVILVTHHLSYAKEADKVVVLKNGAIEAEGKLDTLMNRNLEILQIFEEELRRVESTLEESFQGNEEDHMIPHHDHIKQVYEEIMTSDQIQNVEQEETTLVTRETYINYIKHSQEYLKAFVLILLYGGEQLLILSLTKYIGYWAELQYHANFTAKHLSIENVQPFDNTHHIITVVALTVLVAIVHYFKIRTTINFFLDLNTKMHKHMLAKIAKTFTSFFDETPIGTILNRFSNDIGSLDKTGWNLVYEIMQAATSILFSLSYLCFLSYTIMIPSVFIIYCLYRVKVYYTKPTIEFRRIDLLSRSPMFSMISSTLNGLLTIRVYNQGSHFVDKFMDAVYTNAKVYYMSARTNAILVISLQLFLYSLILGGITFFVFIAHYTELEAAAFGLALFYFVSVGNQSVWLIRQTISMDISMQSVQRIQNYCVLPEESGSEEPQDNDNVHQSTLSPTEQWPSHGLVSFKNVHLKYANTDNYALSGLTFDVQPGSKIGIVGRTGAGKSSIIQALFRIVEIEDIPDSQISIDGVDLRTLSLHTLRTSLSILPQTPVIFAGTIRRNLDPFNTLSEEQLWDALEQVSLKAYVESLDDGIETDMSVSSSVFSAGQKQLICMARVILRKSKVVILDEATANVDMVTDSFIQDKINRVFANRVILTIAHRLSTIAHYDKVLVMDAGKMVEYDHPYRLLVEKIGDKRITNKEGVFTEMVKKGGKRAAEEVFERAYNAYNPSVNS